MTKTNLSSVNEDNQQIYTKEEIENMHERLVINGQGEEREVKPLPETIISKPQHQLGLTTFSEYITKAQEMSEFRRGESLWKDEIKMI